MLFPSQKELPEEYRKSNNKKLGIACASQNLQENKLSASKLLFINNSTDVLAMV